MLNETERRRERQRAFPPLREATVMDPPLDAEGFLRVEIDGERGTTVSCPFARTGAPGDPDPTPDDAAAVIESDGGNYWAIWWPNG